MYKNNLWRAFLALFNSYSLMNLILNIDRLGNAITGGYYRYTISGRVGYFAIMRPNKYWLFLQWVIDSTFYPIEGRGHCKKAFKFEAGKRYRRGNDVALFLLSLFVVAGCVFLAPIIWLISLVVS